jgi:hypothetical protein
LRRKALEVKLPDSWFRAEAVFDDANLVSFAGLAPLLALAERAGLSELIGERVWIDPTATKVESAGANPVGKLTSIIAGMAAGADCIDDLDVVQTTSPTRSQHSKIGITKPHGPSTGDSVATT